MEKKKKKRSSKNLNISTRITLSIIFGTVIPLTVVAIFSTMFLNTLSSYFSITTVNSNSYSLINQFQWDRTLTNISDELVSEQSDEEKLSEIKEYTDSIEKLGAVIYIENASGEFYSTNGKENALKTANSVTQVNPKQNTYYFSENGMVIVTHTGNTKNDYTIIVANSRYNVSDIFEVPFLYEFSMHFFGRTTLILAVIALVFVLSAVILSFITSSTIIKPIRKLEEGANEISKGNLDYVIDYDSTNEIGVTVAAFNEMTTQLKASLDYQKEIEDSRRQMVAGIAHDLRTPLTSVKGYVEGLMDGIADTPEKQERYLKTIYKSTTAMEKMLEELLTVSKLEYGIIGIDLHEVNINDFLEDCYNYMKVFLDQKGFDFIYTNNCAGDVSVMLDSDQFERVIRNILSNSVRYSRSDVKGRIEISADEYKKNVIISISDNGIGMSAENMPKMFDSFYRADPARTRVSEGSGLGLYVCKQIVELHGGRIWATGKEGSGLTIHVSLDKVSQENNENALKGDNNNE